MLRLKKVWWCEVNLRSCNHHTLMAVSLNSHILYSGKLSPIGGKQVFCWEDICRLLASAAKRHHTPQILWRNFSQIATIPWNLWKFFHSSFPLYSMQMLGKQVSTQVRLYHDCLEGSDIECSVRPSLLNLLPLFHCNYLNHDNNTVETGCQSAQSMLPHARNT